MTTSTDIKEQIEKALDDAFRKTKTLQIELVPKIDTNIKNHWGNLKLNNELSDLVNLIDDFDRKGFLDELVIAAIRANPKNSQLVDLTQKHRMDDINPVLKNKELSQEFDNLWSIICTINKDIIISECLKILSLFDFTNAEKSDLEYKFKDLKNIEGIFCYVLKKFLLVEREKLNNGTKTVLHFAEDLANNKDVENSVKQELNSWIFQTKNKYNLPRISVSSSTQPYLLIIISPEDNSFRVYAYLMPDNNNLQSIEPIEYEQDGIALEPGIKFDSFHEIKNKVIDSFIEKSQKKLLILKIYTELIIEFFVPVQHLHEKIEQWEILGDWENDVKILGQEYGVVVRSYDLFQNPKLIKALRQLNNKRENFNLLRQQSNSIPHINELDCYCNNWNNLKSKLQNAIGLVLTPPIPENEKIRTKLFQEIISSGIIMVIWKIPNTSGSSQIDKNDDCDLFDSLTNLNKLFLDVKEKRSENHDIFLLCEEPHLDKLPLCPELRTPK